MPEGMVQGWHGNHRTRETPSLRRHRGGAHGQPLAVRRAGVHASGKGLTGEAGGSVRPCGCSSTPPAPPTPHRARAIASIGAAGPTGHPHPQHHLPGRRARDSANPCRRAWSRVGKGITGRARCRVCGDTGAVRTGNLWPVGGQAWPRRSGPAALGTVVARDAAARRARTPGRVPRRTRRRAWRGGTPARLSARSAPPAPGSRRSPRA